jgi:hypothetical protein
MTTIVTYICDRCKKEMPAADKFQVGFVVSTTTQYSIRSPIPQAASSADWCRACCSEMQLHTKWPTPHEATLSTSEKLEEIIRTIVKEAIEDQS